MRSTRDEMIAATGDEPIYATTREALAAARVETAKGGRDGYHYSHGTGRYTLTDGREIEVACQPASDGGVLLGVFCYRVYPRTGEPSRWRPLEARR